MDFKQAIIENAWGGFNMDYGLLHLQLATPFTVLVIILLMIFALNKLLFQPVLRTLDQRKETMSGCAKQVGRLNIEIERLQQDIQNTLDEARREALHVINSGRDESLQEKNMMLGKERRTLEEEMKVQTKELQRDFESARQRFAELNVELSTLVVQRMLN